MIRYKARMIFCVCGVVLLISSAAWAKVLNVPKQFKTIEGALKAAEAGDEVIVAPGTYKEYVRLKEGVILRSYGDEAERAGFVSASRTILQSALADKQIVLGAEGAVLDGFTLLNVKPEFEVQSEQRGVLIKGTSTIVTNCVIANLPFSGVIIEGFGPKGESLVKNNKIHDNQGSGITCNNGAEVLIEGNKIFKNAKSGIENHKRSQPMIKQNEIYDNGIDGIMNSASESTISENNIYKNALNGIGFQKGSKGLVTNNKISDNYQAGIGIKAQAEAVIKNNKISGNMLGIGTMDLKEILVEGNTITNNKVGVGLIRCQGGKVVLRNNDLRGNMMRGISPNFGCELVEENNQL